MPCYDTCCRPEPEITSLVLGQREIKATRKAHQCSDCGAEIPAGSPARTVAVLIDGDFWSGYYHADGSLCLAVLAAL